MYFVLPSYPYTLQVLELVLRVYSSVCVSKYTLEYTSVLILYLVQLNGTFDVTCVSSHGYFCASSRLSSPSSQSWLRVNFGPTKKE